ncbi:lipase [Rhexocercosporidium sp. MPI-PUGE-AT-0058]|nr:lipase [Rhexocercosporidium sp. MPI-PUGE-AT-0058]
MFGLPGISALTGINSHTNKHPNPSTTIYPYRRAGDAPYEIKEADLRSVIYIPKEFKYGADGKTPVILVPGTGSYGGEAYAPNFAKLLKKSSFGDPVWLNIPGRMNDASHRNAEHVAYAISYISAVCGRSVAIVAWSQGNLATQWALKYWPSTRLVVNNFIALSADFHGTIQASALMPFNVGLGNPGVWSQKRHSNFLRTLHDDNGDSAYVPTTSIYSATDEIVQPQFGTGASAYLKDVRNVGVTNCELQQVAVLKPAGAVYSHETVMSNPIAWALAEDAIRHGGPGRLDRIDLNRLSWKIVADGLTVADGAATEALVLSAGASILSYLWKVPMEPKIPQYALAQLKTPVGKVEVGQQPVTVSQTEVAA